MARTKGRLEVLAGWKEIANYLHQGVRTAQRYERELGLPIRRPAAKSKGAVIATTAELDGWVTARPLRDILPLPGPALDNATLLHEFRKQVTDMHRLREESATLRKEVNESLQLLRSSLRSALSEPDLPESSTLQPAQLTEILSFDSTKKKIQ